MAITLALSIRFIFHATKICVSKSRTRDLESCMVQAAAAAVTEEEEDGFKALIGKKNMFKEKQETGYLLRLLLRLLLLLLSLVSDW